MSRVLVVGQGMAGCAAALAARAQGAEVTVVGSSPGATAFGSGVVWHEAAVGAPKLVGALQALFASAASGARFADGWGELREGVFAQPEQAAGDLDPHTSGRGIAVVGFRGAPQLADAEGIAGALRGRGLNAQAREVDLALTAAEARRSPFEWATALDRREELDRLARVLGRVARGEDLLLLPPILGWRSETFAELAMRLKGRVAELVATQPAVPGLRLARGLSTAVERSGCRILRGTVRALASGRARVQTGDGAEQELGFDGGVLASGRYLGGGIQRRGAFSEPLLGLPLSLGSGRPIDSNEPIERLVGSAPGEAAPVFELGVTVDWDLHPLDTARQPVPWLWAAGSVLAGRERGLAFAMRTGLQAGEAAASGRTVRLGDAA